MSTTAIDPDTLFDASAIGMSHARLDEDSGLLFCSGQVDRTADNGSTSTEYGGQMESALRNVGLLLEGAGASITDLMHLRILVRGEASEHMAEIGGPLMKFLGGHRPAMTLVGVASLISPGTLIEIEAVAKVPRK